MFTLKFAPFWACVFVANLAHFSGHLIFGYLWLFIAICFGLFAAFDKKSKS